MAWRMRRAWASPNSVRTDSSLAPCNSERMPQRGSLRRCASQMAKAFVVFRHAEEERVDPIWCPYIVGGTTLGNSFPVTGDERAEVPCGWVGPCLGVGPIHEASPKDGVDLWGPCGARTWIRLCRFHVVCPCRTITIVFSVASGELTRELVAPAVVMSMLPAHCGQVQETSSATATVNAPLLPPRNQEFVHRRPPAQMKRDWSRKPWLAQPSVPRLLNCCEQGKRPPVLTSMEWAPGTVASPILLRLCF
jgi:hypothetical protein